MCKVQFRFLRMLWEGKVFLEQGLFKESLSMDLDYLYFLFLFFLAELEKVLL